jgi:hypothetical protein
MKYLSKERDKKMSKQKKKESAVITKKADEIEECINLLSVVNSMKPREKWVAPLIKSVNFQDFRTQLFTIIEDYRKYWTKDKMSANDDS